MNPNLLGWIPPSQRTQAQMDAHEAAVKKMTRFAITGKTTEGPVCVKLFDSWYHPKVIADCGGVKFYRFWQQTGSCVGAGGGNGLFSLVAIQRLFADNPTKAFIPFWLFNYGRSRYLAGDRSPGEGSMGATFAQSIKEDGVYSWTESAMPTFADKGEDGIMVSSRIEMEYSDGDSRSVLQFSDLAKAHPIGTAAEITNIQQARESIINGYPLLHACSEYINSASIQGSGAEACVIGRHDSSGGHQTSYHAVWDHPRFGPLYGQLNNWPTSVYPRCPTGAPPCFCWVKEVDFIRTFRMEAEIYAISHLNWFPAQPAIAVPWVV